MGEVVKPSNHIDIAGKENAATHTATVFAQWRKDVPLEVSYRYWRDVHSIMVACIPDIYQYRLLELASNRADLWSAIHGIDYTLTEADQPHGVTEMLFLTSDNPTYSKQFTVLLFADNTNPAQGREVLLRIGDQ